LSALAFAAAIVRD